MTTQTAIVVGAGFGGLTAACALAAHGVDVTLLEAADAVGGKAGERSVDGASFDTGPSLLTMPDVLDRVFGTAGRDRRDFVTLRRADRCFRYLYPDGVALDVHHDVDATYRSVASTLGRPAADELRGFLEYAEGIWQAAAPAFIYGDAPSPRGLLSMGLRRLAGLSRIDAHRTMWSAICDRVQSPHLRQLLARYATYNGSDVRRAPATLNCIAHVELTMGGFGVRGGMHQLALSLRDLFLSLGGSLRLGCPVGSIDASESERPTVVTSEGARLTADIVVSNVDPRHLVEELLAAPAQLADDRAESNSMSGWTAVVRARRDSDRAPHSVLFAPDYLDEFAAIFDRGTLTSRPTVYACDQAATHGRAGWADGVPLFVMINAPAVTGERQPIDWERVGAAALDRLREAGIVERDDPVVWARTPLGLAERFPGSGGSIYGAASNSPFAAFRRLPSRLRPYRGLLTAGGGSHPGGGVPLCLLSGLAAARAGLAELDVEPHPSLRVA